MIITLRRRASRTLERARQIFDALAHRPLTLAFLSGTLTLAAFYVPHFWWVIFFALVPFIHASRIARTWNTALLQSVLFGSMLIGGATFATLSASLPPSVGLTDPLLERALVFMSWLLFFVPLVPTVIAWAFVVRSVRHVTIIAAFGLSALWVVLEWARMFLFNIATYAPGVDNPPFFSASFLGYVLADSESWLQFAAIGGVYLMSGIAIFVNISVYGLWQIGGAMRNKLLALLAFVVVLVTIVPIASVRAIVETRSTVEIPVGFMSLTDKHPYDSFSEKTRHVVKELSLQDPYLILLPEGASFVTTNETVQHPETYQKSKVLTSKAADGPGVYARVAELRTVGGDLLAAVRGKSALAAQGEYISGFFLWIAEIIGMRDQIRIAHLSSARWANPSYVGPDNVPVSIVFCSEILAPLFGRELVERDKSAFLAFVLAHDQFHGSYTLKTDTLRFLKVRTVEAGVPSVSSALGTPAYAFDRFGHVFMSAGTNAEPEFQIARLKILSTGRF